MIDISGQAKSGRYVIVQMDNNEMLNLREVEVFGTKSESVEFFLGLEQKFQANRTTLRYISG